jgi:hypothetical protein
MVGVVPLLLDAVNCSAAEPDEVVVLQPVQLVSMAAVPGETESELPDEPEADPPQPATTNAAGTTAAAASRPIPRATRFHPKLRPVRRAGGIRRSFVTTISWLDLPKATLSAFSAFSDLDSSFRSCVSAEARNVCCTNLGFLLQS